MDNKTLANFLMIAILDGVHMYEREDRKTMLEEYVKLSNSTANDGVYRLVYWPTEATDRTYGTAASFGRKEAKITNTQYNAILALKREEKKINAIKELRTITGWGLKESKECVESNAIFPPRYSPFG